MLLGINPLLSGLLLMYLDEMGHSDLVVVADANFPAARIGRNVVELPGCSAVEVTRAIRSVLPLDGDAAGVVMECESEPLIPIHQELAEAAGTTVVPLERQAFYDLAESAFLIVRTGETRPYGNLGLKKGVVG